MVQLTWQGSPEVVRNYKKALETLNMLILPHLLKKKKKKIGQILILSTSVSPYVSLSHLFFLSFCWGIWKKNQVMK